MSYFDVLFGYEWELTKSPAAPGSGRRRIWQEKDMAPDPEDASKRCRS
jgi:catalase-peroxidase